MKPPSSDPDQPTDLFSDDAEARGAAGELPRNLEVAPERGTLPEPFRAPDVEAFEGAYVMDEVPDALGVLLWRTLQEVQLWCWTAGPAREGLFPAGAQEHRLAELLALPRVYEVEDELRALSRLLDRPERVRSMAVYRVCDRISRWAQEEEKPATALGYARAAALARPDQARAARRVALLSLEMGRYPEAEQWARLTLQRARTARDAESLYVAHAVLGYLAWETAAEDAVAERHLQRSLGVAGRSGLPGAREIAHLNLAAHHSIGRRWTQAVVHAEAGTESPLGRAVPAAALNLAAMLNSLDRPDWAARLLQNAAPVLSMPSHQLLLAGTRACAAAGTGDRGGFEAGWDRVHTLARRPHLPEKAPAAFQSLARGALGLGEPERARTAAELALRLAQRTGDQVTTREARRLLDCSRDAGAAAERRERPEPEPSSAAATGRLVRLAERMVRR